MEVKPGGVWEHVMHGPDGRNYENRIVYVEVVKPERIVYDHVSYPPFRSTVLFEEEGAKTAVSMRMVFESAELLAKVEREHKAIEGLSSDAGPDGRTFGGVSGGCRAYVQCADRDSVESDHRGRAPEEVVHRSNRLI